MRLVQNGTDESADEARPGEHVTKQSSVGTRRKMKCCIVCSGDTEEEEVDEEEDDDDEEEEEDDDDDEEEEEDADGSGVLARCSNTWESCDRISG